MDRTDTMTSTTLLNKVAGGDDESANAHFDRRYRPLVMAFARSFGLGPQDSEDVAQDVMIAAFETLVKAQYDRGQGRFKQYLKGIVVNKLRKALERQRREKARMHPAGSPRAVGAVCDRDTEELADPRPGPVEELETRFEDEWRRFIMQQAEAEARRETREPETWQAYELCCLRDWPPAKAAKFLGMTRGAVNNATLRVREAIKAKAGELSDSWPGRALPGA